MNSEYYVVYKIISTIPKRQTIDIKTKKETCSFEKIPTCIFPYHKFCYLYWFRLVWFDLVWSVFQL